MIMNVQQLVHNVVSVKATVLYPANSNQVTIEIQTEGGVLSQSLFFGCSTQAAGQANALFYALGGTEAGVNRNTSFRAAV